MSDETPALRADATDEEDLTDPVPEFAKGGIIEGASKGDDTVPVILDNSTIVPSSLVSQVEVRELVCPCCGMAVCSHTWAFVMRPVQ